MCAFELGGKLESTARQEETPATGTAGTGYLCHPFLVHAAQQHRGVNEQVHGKTAVVSGGTLQFRWRVTC